MQGDLDLARPGVLPSGLLRSSAIILSALGLALMLISLQPFEGESLVSASGAKQGSAINQFGFLAAGLVFALALLCLTSRKVLASLLTPGLLMFGIVLAYNVALSPQPEAELRAVVLTVIGMFIAFSVIVLPRGEKDFQIALIAATAATLAMSYGGLLLVPHLATHGYDSAELQHVGLWRGHFSHKNVAGPVMCAIAIFGVYLIRSGHRFAGLIIFAASTLFVLKTGSKTTNGFFPVSIMIVLLAGIFRNSAVAVLAFILAWITAGVFTLGSLYSPSLSQLVGDLLGDATYTGRTTLWEFGLSRIPEHPWLGYGLYNFWGSDLVVNLDRPFESPWDFRTIVHGHNNYIDMVLSLGVLGGSVVFWVLFVGPVFNYVKARRIPGNAKLADMFFMIIVFMSLLSFLETFFLARSNSLWLMHAFAVFGLHVLARFSMGSSLAGR
ncbi:MAG: hypothetical protein VR78_02715 [Hoeflea sp. BRH_c9]|nr:MAG: hypothetical protein VR78_02715 [Hoeflea sp. BRH_c9]